MHILNNFISPSASRRKHITSSMLRLPAFLNCAMRSKFGQSQSLLKCVYDSLIVSSPSSYLHESQNASMAPPKTPYGAGRMTPGRTPARTPGHMSSISAMSSMQSMSVRNPSATPRHFGASSAFSSVPSSSGGTPMSNFGGSTLGAPSTLGFQTPRGGNGGFTPRPGGPPAPPPGMNPQRASMIQESGGWGSSGGGWGS